MWRRRGFPQIGSHRHQLLDVGPMRRAGYHLLAQRRGGGERHHAGADALLLCQRPGFERIHRSNLINMGVLPLSLPPEVTPQNLRLVPGDRVTIAAAPEQVTPRALIAVDIAHDDGRQTRFTARADVETAAEVDILRQGGMLPAILRRRLQAS